MLINKAHFNEMTNYEKLITTSMTFKNSQGFYSRLFESLMEMSKEDIKNLNQYDNFKKCNSILDVVLELEQ